MCSSAEETGGREGNDQREDPGKRLCLQESERPESINLWSQIFRDCVGEHVGAALPTSVGARDQKLGMNWQMAISSAKQSKPLEFAARSASLAEVASRRKVPLTHGEQSEGKGMIQGTGTATREQRDREGKPRTSEWGHLECYKGQRES